MKISRKKRDILIIIGALVIILIVSAVFLFWPENKNIKENQENSAGFSINGNFIENKRGGLSFLIPEGWIVKDYGVDGLGIFSPEIEFDEIGGFLRSAEDAGGCLVSVRIIEEEQAFEYLEIIIEEIKNGESFLYEEEGGQEVINISGKESLKTAYSEDGRLVYVKIEIPVDNIIYEFSNGIIFSERCVVEFDGILNTIVINN